MHAFVRRHEREIVGTVCGFDRVLFRGTLRSLAYEQALAKFLSCHDVLLKDFSTFAQRLSDRLKTHAEQLAARLKRPLLYVESPKASKEAMAQAVIEKDGIREGLICILSCVEPCQSFGIRSDPLTRHLLLKHQVRKCLHLYFYYLDRDFGLMHVRLQTWLPMTIQVCVNGREWLARALDRAHLGYEQRGNCFTWLEDPLRAQALLDHLVERKWARLLNVFARRVNPWLKEGSGGLDLHPYYWTVRQAEVATDVLFRDSDSLQRLYPQLVRHAIEQFHSDDVLRFFGKRTTIRFSGEVKTELTKRIEGLCVKHWVEANSLKMYDKQASILRIETTVNNVSQFKVRRHVEWHGQTGMAWVPMRKGVVDVRRLVQVARAANERYLEALANIGAETPPSHTLLDRVSEPVVCAGRRYRALRPVSPDDAALFAQVYRAASLLQGVRNKDLSPVRRAKEPPPNAAEARRRTGQNCRRLRLLRAHGLLYKVPHTNYYRITQQGHQIMTTALKFRASSLSLLAA